jgi:hypothetical protein
MAKKKSKYRFILESAPKREKGGKAKARVKDALDELGLSRKKYEKEVYSGSYSSSGTTKKQKKKIKKDYKKFRLTAAEEAAIVLMTSSASTKKYNKLEKAVLKYGEKNIDLEKISDGGGRKLAKRLRKKAPHLASFMMTHIDTDSKDVNVDAIAEGVYKKDIKKYAKSVDKKVAQVLAVCYPIKEETAVDYRSLNYVIKAIKAIGVDADFSDIIRAIRRNTKIKISKKAFMYQTVKTLLLIKGNAWNTKAAKTDDGAKIDASKVKDFIEGIRTFVLSYLDEMGKGDLTDLLKKYISSRRHDDKDGDHLINFVSLSTSTTYPKVATIVQKLLKDKSDNDKYLS